MSRGQYTYPLDCGTAAYNEYRQEANQHLKPRDDQYNRYDDGVTQ